MSEDKKSGAVPSVAKSIEGIKADFGTIRIILLTAATVLVILVGPLLYILRNFVTFDALDKYLKVTDSVRPKILHGISEEIEAGYSKNIVLDSQPANDNSLIFYADAKQKVRLTIDATTRRGNYQKVGLQIDGCNIPSAPDDSRPFHFYNHDVTSNIEQCNQAGEPNVHVLRVYTQQALKPGTTLDVSCLILVSERVHDPVENRK